MKRWIKGLKQCFTNVKNFTRSVIENMSILKKGIELKSEKYANKLEIKKYGNKLKMEISDHRTKE